MRRYATTRLAAAFLVGCHGRGFLAATDGAGSGRF